MTSAEEFQDFVDDVSQESVARITKPVLGFAFQERNYLVDVLSIYRVLRWQEPAAVPIDAKPIIGVVQDAGSLIAVLSDPMASGTTTASPKRLIVCNTSKGLIGFPADTTFAEEQLPVDLLKHSSNVESEHGVATYLIPETMCENFLTTNRE